MPLPIELSEWQLLQRLGTLLEQKKTKYQRRSTNSSISHPDHEFLEFELRRAFIPRDSLQNLPANDFGELQVLLARQCAFLDEAVIPAVHPVPDQVLYPRLQGLARFLEGSSNTFDLITGPNQPLFRLSSSPDQIRTSLASLSACNDAIGRLLSSQKEPVVQRPSKEKGKRPWKHSEKRARAISTLEALFRHFTCGAPHELMIKSSEGLEDLQLLLSSCPDSKFWQDVRCTLSERYVQ